MRIEKVIKTESVEEVSFKTFVAGLLKNPITTARTFDSAADAIEQHGESLHVGEPVIRQGLRALGLHAVSSVWDRRACDSATEIKRGERS